MLFAESNACPPTEKDEPAGPLKVVVDQSEFVGNNPLTTSEQADIVKTIYYVE